MEILNSFFGNRSIDSETEQNCINILENELFVTTLNPIQIENILQVIQRQREHELKMIYHFVEKINDSELPYLKEEKVKYFKNRRKGLFDEFDKIETLCNKEFKLKTRHIKIQPAENLQIKHVALILHFLKEAKYINIKSPKKGPNGSIQEEMHKLGFVSQSPETVYGYFYLTGTKKERAKYYDPLTVENIEIILPYLKKYSNAFSLAENKIEELKRT